MQLKNAVSYLEVNTEIGSPGLSRYNSLENLLHEETLQFSNDGIEKVLYLTYILLGYQVLWRIEPFSHCNYREHGIIFIINYRVYCPTGCFYPTFSVWRKIQCT